MMLYALIGLSLVLLGIAGLQFTYMFYLERLHNERKRYLTSLEHKCRGLTAKLEAAEQRLLELEASHPDLKISEEIWADVIDER